MDIPDFKSGPMNKAAKYIEDVAKGARQAQIMKHFEEGTLPFKLYKTLSPQLQRKYSFLWGGRPTTKAEKDREQKAAHQRAKKRREAKQARKRAR